MMKTAITSPASLPSFSPEATSTQTDESPRQSRIHSRTYLDVFNPPLDVHNAMSPGNSPAIGPTSPTSIPGRAPPAEVTFSPCTIPNSFQSTYMAQGQDLASPQNTPCSPPPSGSFSKLPASPALNFRKARHGSSAASLSREIEDLHLGEALQSPASGSSSGSGILHHYHHHHHHYQQTGHSPLVSSFTVPEPTRKMSTSDVGLTQEDLDATATVEEVKNPELLQRYVNSQKLSPPPPVRKGSMVETIAEHLPPIMPIEETTISSSIPLYEMPADMLLPLVDRPKDVKNLVNHPCRARFIQILRNSLGEELYDKKLLKLWLETDRKEVSDAEWLWKTKSIILQRPGAGSSCRDGKLWGDFCDMVGWDEDDLSIDNAGPAEDRAMEKIAEGDEEEEEEYRSNKNNKNEQKS